MSTSKEFKTELENCGKMPLFELEHNGEWFLWNIDITDNGWITADSNESHKLDCSVRVDGIFTLGEHLAELLSIAEDKLINY